MIHNGNMCLHECPRRLLVEQLESRCLMAAGVFTHFGNHHTSDHVHRNHRADENPGAAEIRSVGVERSTDHVTRRERDIPDRRDRDGRGHGSRRDNDQLVQNSPSSPDIASRFDVSPSTPSESIERTRGQSTPSTERGEWVIWVLETDMSATDQMMGSQSSGSSDRSDSNNDASTLVSMMMPMDGEMASGKDVASVPSENARETSADTVSPNVVATNITDGGELEEGSQTQSKTDQERLSPFGSVDRMPVDAGHETTSESEIADDEIGGLIESLPLRHREQQPVDGSGPKQEWAVAPSSIDRLREVVREASGAEIGSATTNDDPTSRPTDAVIASWFGNQTGLMEIEATGRLQSPVDLSESIVDVVLNAQIGLHRSVDLIASTMTVADITSDDVRGAILNAIAAEQPRQSIVLDSTYVPRKLSKLTYSGVALLATGISLAARRKRAEYESSPPE
ncbi:hypothetical protein [Aporhodopirellula aestuarii]|uniref:Uncharacterized protein n=1 Tax=Aporhodopirellula aestuarii TaxID=2950107 RepID=A0ABT0TWY0_9BACT|nr:hypothetical protein [Aporhodopirellula aestuarii]MCM2368996.1 hypothetical protein [Aporhodopirellula aestuarii]